MSDFQVQRQPVFYNNKRFAEVTGAGFKFNMNSQPLYTDAGYSGETDGAIVTELTINVIRPEDPASVPWLQDMLARKRIPFDVPIGDGKVLSAATARIINGSLDWKNESGMFEGALTVRFGSPQIQ